MNAPTLWDRVLEAEEKIRNGQRPAPDAPDLLEKRLAALPKSRLSDPSTSHEAAVSVKPGNSDLIKAIRLYVEFFNPATAFDIAQHVAREHPGRWKEGSIRTRVSALEKNGTLQVVDELGVEGSCHVRRYRLAGE